MCEIQFKECSNLSLLSRWNVTLLLTKLRSPLIHKGAEREMSSLSEERKFYATERLLINSTLITYKRLLNGWERRTEVVERGLWAERVVDRRLLQCYIPFKSRYESRIQVASKETFFGLYIARIKSIFVRFCPHFSLLPLLSSLYLYSQWRARVYFLR